MPFPEFVNKGEAITARWANDVVSSIKSDDKNIHIKTVSQKTVKRNPFDVSGIRKEADKWYIRLQPALYFELDNNPYDVKYDGVSLKTLSGIEVPEGKDLYFNYKDKSVVWSDTNIGLKILDFEYIGGGDFKIKNLHPYNVDIRNYPPFTPLISNDDGDIYVAVTPGLVIERTTNETANCLIIHEPNNLKSAGALVHHAIADGEQLACKFTTDVKGEIDTGTVQIAIENIDEPTIHYFPKAGDDSTGTTGDYHHKLFEFEGITSYKSFGGSDIEHYHEIPELKNGIETGTTGIARIIKEYNKNENRFVVRTLSEKASDPQVKVEESDNKIIVKGNGKDSIIRYQIEGGAYGDVGVFKDGLNTLEGTMIIPIPSLSALDSLSGINVNLHVRSQGEGTDPDGWVAANFSVKTLCWRSGILKGTITQADPDTLTEICTDIEVSAPGDLISLTCSDIDPHS